ncbi:gamma-glutamyl-hercynylcysteine sulfoxide hydrolase [Actinoplanes philippinensis]|uniref:Gamma-glutamyl-hercynylcysteine sulfoxide hydrolase n=1 Tax=Actinoplanes philippinensis TaxID=35752 RepID=A0A1I2M4Q3_9ACTN|nr:ergothioneine biosynthesis protein EgtC [Actinoplanes philippinensis]GIE82877.1 gamma-glutamyl-hercynylcysteine sulfoxide hydrolase [Actinoplanes philippinensis]SFF84221.1 glutamine amidotransferase [Actinoplanes philippinensis]
MCRHLGYLGPPVPLKDLLFDPPHALATQAWAPRDMRGGGTVNADGFGVGWWPPGAAAPVRHRSAMPIWTDASLPLLAAATSAGAVLAAVRSATVGMPVVETAAAPFTDGRWLFSHNGVVRGWPSAVAAQARDLPVEDLLTLDAPTDSAILWAMVRARLRAGEPPAKAVATVVTEVAAAAPGSRLNLLLSDGRQMIATTLGHALSARSLRDSTLISSEPLDPGPAWQPVPDGRLVVATAGRLEITSL